VQPAEGRPARLLLPGAGVRAGTCAATWSAPQSDRFIPVRPSLSDIPARPGRPWRRRFQSRGFRDHAVEPGARFSARRSWQLLRVGLAPRGADRRPVRAQLGGAAAESPTIQRHTRARGRLKQQHGRRHRNRITGLARTARPCTSPAPGKRYTRVTFPPLARSSRRGQSAVAGRADSTDGSHR
jgi:hypothetical protein